MKNSTIRQLSAFHAVARLGSVSKAAEEMHLTQPAVSLQLGILEEAAGTPLLKRSARGVKLTEAGELLASYASRILELWREAGDAMAQHCGDIAGLLRIGAVTTAEYLLPPLLLEFVREHPQVKVKLSVGNRAEIVGQLASQEIDLAIMGRPPAELKTTSAAFAKHPMAFVAAPTHPLMRHHRLGLDALADANLLVRERGSGTRTTVEQLDLVLGGAAVRVLVRDHFALLGAAVPAADGAGRQGRDRAARGRAAPADRATSTVEEGNLHAELLAQPCHRGLRLRELPVRREVAAVLVRIGVPDHHFLDVAVRTQAALHQRHREQLLQDRGRAAQVRDGLQQRHHRQRAALGRQRVVEQARVLGEQVDAQHVGRAMGHAEDQRAEGFAIDLVSQLGNGAESRQRLARLGREPRNVDAAAVAAQRRCERPEQPILPGRRIARRRVGHRGTHMPLAPDLGERRVDADRVLADVEPHGREAEGPHLVQQGRNEARRERRGVGLAQRPAHRVDVVDQLIGVGVAIDRTRTPLAGGDRRVELAQHARDELPEELARVALRDALALDTARQRGLDERAKALRQRHLPLTDAQVAPEVGQPHAVAAQARHAHLPQRVPRDLAGDERVAVAVAADPRAEAEDHRQLDRLAGELLDEGGLDAVDQLGHDVEKVLVEEVQAPGHLLVDRGLLELEFAREPEDFDLVGDRAHQVVALAVGPARRLELVKLEVDAPVPLEHCDPLGLGRVRRDHRADAQPAQRVAHGLRVESCLGGRVEDVREAATHLRVASRAFELATPAHVAVLLGDLEQLEPDRLGLDRARKQARAHRLARRLATHQPGDVGLMALDHAEQGLAKQFRATERVGRLGLRSRLVGVGEIET